MDEARAKELLTAEAPATRAALSDTTRAGQEEREAEHETGDIADPAESFTSQEGDDAIERDSQAQLPPSNAPRLDLPTAPTVGPSRVASRSRTTGWRQTPPPSSTAAEEAEAEVE